MNRGPYEGRGLLLAVLSEASSQVKSFQTQPPPHYPVWLARGSLIQPLWCTEECLKPWPSWDPSLRFPQQLVQLSPKGGGREYLAEAQLHPTCSASGEKTYAGFVALFNAASSGDPGDPVTVDSGVP